MKTGWSIGNGWCVLLLPTIFDKLNENTLHLFGAVNVVAIVIVWALYPESNQRTLEEMDLVFAADSIWVWDAEKNFARLKEENPQLVQAAAKHADIEAGAASRRASRATAGSSNNKVASKGLAAENKELSSE